MAANKADSKLLEELSDATIEYHTSGRLAVVCKTKIELEIMRRFESTLPQIFAQYRYLVGSLFEGMPEEICSDADAMLVMKTFPIIKWSKDHLDRSNCFIGEHNPRDPVYIRLQANHSSSLPGNFKYWIDENGYLNNRDFISGNENPMLEFYTAITKTKTHGPAIEANSEAIDYSGNKIKRLIDVVLCLKCISWPLITDDFFKRQRLSNWPSEKLLRKVASFSLFGVPVGNPNSEQTDVEWRLSFSLVERELIHEIDESYAKAMFALKAIKKRHTIFGNSNTTPFCSYFIKTACLWMAETLPHKDSSNMNLIRKILDWLIDCYRRMILPHYFIPQQNLLRHLTQQQCDNVLQTLIKIRNNLWEMIVLSVKQCFVFVDMCENLKIPVPKTNEDCRALEKVLHDNPDGKKEISKAISRLRPDGNEICIYNIAKYIKLSQLSMPCHTGRIWLHIDGIIKHYHLKIFKLIEEVIVPVIENINGIVPQDYVTFCKHSLYRYVGDLCTSLLIILRNKTHYDLSIYLKMPLHYYTLGAEMVFPDGWSDEGTGGLALKLKYFYLMGYHEELKEELINATFPTVLDDQLNYRSVSIQMRASELLERNLWSKLPKIVQRHGNGSSMIIHPIMFIFYIISRVSLREEGCLDSARLFMNKIKDYTPFYDPKLQQSTQLLIEVIEIEILEAERMLYFRKPPSIIFE